jgi:hypothetical protein
MMSEFTVSHQQFSNICYELQPLRKGHATEAAYTYFDPFVSRTVTNRSQETEREPSLTQRGNWFEGSRKATQ